MCRVECSSFERFASPYSSAEALVMPSNRHCERSTGVVSVLVKVKSVPLPTTMSVRVPPLSILIRRSMIVPFRLGEMRAAGLGFGAAAANLKSAGSANGLTCPLFGHRSDTGNDGAKGRQGSISPPSERAFRSAHAWGMSTACSPGLRRVSHSDTPRKPQSTENRARAVNQEASLRSHRGERRTDMADVAARRQRITAARAGFLATGTAHESAVPDVVAASWQRSRSAGVDASTSEASFHSDLDTSSRLVRCSRPIIDRLSEETANIPLSIAVTDGKARVLTRVDNSRTIGLLLDKVSFAPGFVRTRFRLRRSGHGNQRRGDRLRVRAADPDRGTGALS